MTDRRGVQRRAASRDLGALRLIRRCTWRGQPVLPRWLVIVQSLQHDIHGEHKQAGQEGVEGYIEEKNEACGERGERVVSTASLKSRSIRAAKFLLISRC